MTPRVDDAADVCEDVRPSSAVDAAAAVFPLLDQGVIIVGADRAVVAVNSAAERMMGRSGKELQHSLGAGARLPMIRPDGSPWPFEQRPPFVAMRTRTAVRNAVLGYFRPDGSLVWLATSAVPIALSNGPGVAIMFSDITETFTDRQRFRMLFDHSAVAGWIVDANDHTITAVNDRLLHWLGYARDELIGASHLRVLHPSDHDRVCDVRGDVSRWEHHRMDLRFLHADGSTVWGVAEAIAITDPATGRVARLVQAFDASAHVAALAKATDSNRRFQIMFERSLSPSMVVDLTVRPGRVLAANRAFCDFGGFEPGALAMALATELVNADDRPALVAALDALALDVVEEAIVPVRLRTGHGDDVVTELSLVAIPSAPGTARSAIVQVSALGPDAARVLRGSARGTSRQTPWEFGPGPWHSGSDADVG